MAMLLAPLDREPEFFSEWQSCDGSVMVWRSFNRKGKSTVAILNGRQDYEAYKLTLFYQLLPFADEKHEGPYVFQKDNASIHTSKSASMWFLEQKITLLPWPALSPGLNPIENLWGIMARDVYQNERQFQSVSDLSTAVLRSWDKISQKTLDYMVNSLRRRCIEVIIAKGGEIAY
jgi:transposase